MNLQEAINEATEDATRSSIYHATYDSANWATYNATDTPTRRTVYWFTCKTPPQETLEIIIWWTGEESVNEALT